MEESFAVDRGGFREAVSLASKALPKRSVIPVIKHLKVVANGDVAVTATDLENRVEIRLPRAEGANAFTLLLPGDLVAKHLKARASTPLRVVRQEFAATFDGAIQMNGLDPQDYPTEPDYSWKPVASIPAHELADAIRAVSFAVSDGGVRLILSGLLIDIRKNGEDDGQGHVVASNGKHLAEHRFPARLADEKGLRTVINLRAAELLAALCQKTGEGAEIEFEVALSDTGEPVQVRFVGPGVKLWARIVEGNFPNWEAVIPADKSYRHSGFEVEVKPLIEALDIVSVAFVKDKEQVELQFSGTKLELHAQSEACGQAKAEIPCKSKGAERSIRVNPLYLAEYLRSIPKTAQSVRVLLISEKDVATKWTWNQGKNVYVLMPIGKKS